MEPSSELPLPSSPYWLTPHFQTVPSERSAIELASPDQTDTTLLSPTTWTGVGLGVVVPSPSSPLEFSPQAQAVPSDLSAIAWNHPPEMETMFDRPITCTGR